MPRVLNNATAPVVHQLRAQQAHLQAAFNTGLGGSLEGFAFERGQAHGTVAAQALAGARPQPVAYSAARPDTQ